MTSSYVCNCGLAFYRRNKLEEHAARCATSNSHRCILPVASGAKSYRCRHCSQLWVRQNAIWQKV